MGTMSVLGLGDIGLATARRATGFGITVHSIDIRPLAAPGGVKTVWQLSGLDDVLSIVDLLMVTAPLTADTTGLIDRKRIDLLPSGAFVIVVSRGGRVIEEALADALPFCRPAGAGLDATDHEPPPSASPLWDLENVIMSQRPRPICSMPGGDFKENLARHLDADLLLHVCDKRSGF